MAIVKITPYELGKLAGKKHFETKEREVMPDFATDIDKSEWELGAATGYFNAEKEAQQNA